MFHIYPFISPETLNGLRNSKVVRGEEILLELQERGHLEVGGDGWWKVEVLIAMTSRVSAVASPIYSLLD